MKIFLAGPFRTPEEQELLSGINKLLIDNNFQTWWAVKDLGLRGYEIPNSKNSLKKIIKLEENAILKCDALVAVMKKASFGTAMEIKHAFDHKKPVVAYILADHPDFEKNYEDFKSASIRSKVYPNWTVKDEKLLKLGFLKKNSGAWVVTPEELLKVLHKISNRQSKAKKIGLFRFTH